MTMSAPSPQPIGVNTADEQTLAYYQTKINDLRIKISTLEMMVKEVVTNAGRNPMDHQVRQRLLFDLKVDEARTRAEYFVMQDYLQELFYRAK